MAASGSPIPPTASATTRASRRSRKPRRRSTASIQDAADRGTDELGQPNGICFSPDYKKRTSWTPNGPDIRVFDIDGKALKNGKRFVAFDNPTTGAPSYADGIRCDADGNIWAGAPPGVQVFTPGAERIGMIRLPETCANLCFGGQKRNRLFMAASQSLYSVYVETTGAHIA
jgi:gluconolactonase